jgi:hypothetical protein
MELQTTELNLENLDQLNQLSIDVNTYIDRINFYDIYDIPYNILSEYYVKNNIKTLDNLFIKKFNIFKNKISKSNNFEDLAYFYIRISNMCNLNSKQNNFFYNYKQNVDSNNFYTYKKLLTYLSFKILLIKNLKSVNSTESILNVINQYLKSKKSNDESYILYNNILNNLIKQLNIDSYCFTAINFCLENNLLDINYLNSYKNISDIINNNVNKLLNYESIIEPINNEYKVIPEPITNEYKLLTKPINNDYKFKSESEFTNNLYKPVSTPTRSHEIISPYINSFPSNLVYN